MKDTKDEGYPGENASAAELGRLADQYAAASRTLRGAARKRDPLSYFPARFCALHAIELYLNACIRGHGGTPAAIRGLHHDLSRMALEAVGRGLVLKKKRLECLSRLTDQREYLLHRYGPEVGLKREELNSVEATLDEIARKVYEALKWKRAPEGASMSSQGGGDHSAG